MTLSLHSVERPAGIALLLFLLAVALGVGSAQAQNPPRLLATGLLTETQERRLDASAHRMMERIYQGRMAEAERLAESMLAMAFDDPRSHLLHARLLREYLSDQNTHRHSIEEQTEAVNQALDRALEAAEALLEEDEDHLAGRLYRGWSRMFRAQLHTLGGSYWSAGRTSKKAKGDLDFVLEHDPDNPHALLVLGSFYYFADRLPGVLKFAAWLLRIPTGDRDLGLEYLRRAHQSGAVGRQDARAILGLIHFAFETRFGRALPIFEELTEHYPANARLLEPFAMIDFYAPHRIALDRPRLERGIELGRASEDSLTWANAQRVRFYHLQSLAFTGHFDSARVGLEELLAELPPQPDWLEPSTRIALADLHLLGGDLETARAILRSLEKDTRPEEWTRYVFEEEAAATPEQARTLRRLQPAVRALYAGRRDEAERRLAPLAGNGDPAPTFYRAELDFLRRDLEAARRGFARLADEEGRDRHYFLRLLSRLRLGEIAAEQGDLDRAQDTLDEAVDRHRMKDLFRHVADGRRRLFEQAESRVPTTLGLAASAVGSEPD